MFSKVLTTLALLLSVCAQAQIAQQWVNRYTYKDTAAPWEDTDIGYAVAIDAQKNVVVTGSSMRGGPDIVTIKYNAAGSELWRAVYNASGNGNDGGSAITLDAQGNVYVAGGTTVSGQAQFIVLKYNASGVQQWTAGSPKGNASHMAMDGQGNIFVCGYNDSQSYDIVIAKYNPSGVEQWVRRYMGPGKMDDYPKALKVDASGNVYVAGEVRDSTGQAFEMVTIKYNAAGELQWDRLYRGATSKDDRATGLALDPQGNVLVTGSTNVDQAAPWMTDYITIKYDPNGQEIWKKTYNGPANSSDAPIGVEVDGAGCIYVAGISLKYTGSEDYHVIKYTSSGDTLWTARYNTSQGNSQTMRVLALDPAANIYVTGSSQGPTGRDYSTLKFDSSGVRVWVMRYNGPAGPGDEPYGMAVNANGAVAVTGQSQGNTSGLDYATVLYADGGPSGINDRDQQHALTDWKAFPNPFINQTTLHFTLRETATVVIDMYDITGRKIQSHLLPDQGSGTHSVLLDGSLLTNGIYFCKLQTGQAYSYLKLIKEE